jgi:hypothetical protein
VMERAPSSTLRQAAVRAGMVPIREDGLNKMRQGLTSPEEVLRQVYVRVDDYEIEAKKPIETEAVAGAGMKQIGSPWE